MPVSVKDRRRPPGRVKISRASHTSRRSRNAARSAWAATPPPSRTPPSHDSTVSPSASVAGCSQNSMVKSPHTEDGASRPSFAPTSAIPPPRPWNAAPPGPIAAAAPAIIGPAAEAVPPPDPA